MWALEVSTKPGLRSRYWQSQRQWQWWWQWWWHSGRSVGGSVRHVRSHTAHITAPPPPPTHTPCSLHAVPDHHCLKRLLCVSGWVMVHSIPIATHPHPFFQNLHPPLPPPPPTHPDLPCLRGGHDAIHRIARKAPEKGYLEQPRSACCTDNMPEIFVRFGQCLCCFPSVFINRQPPCPHTNSHHVLLRPQMHHRNHWFGKEHALVVQTVCR